MPAFYLGGTQDTHRQREFINIYSISEKENNENGMEMRRIKRENFKINREY